MKAPKGVVRPRRHKVTIELSDVQASALRCLSKRFFGGRCDRVVRARSAEVLLAVAMSDLERVVIVSDKIVDYCQREGLDDRRARMAVYDDRVAAAFRSLPWKTSIKRGER